MPRLRAVTGGPASRDVSDVPVYISALEPCPMDSPDPPTPKPTKTLLIVEDDFDIREALSQVLADEGYKVHGAANGLEGLKALRETRDVSLVVLDLMMPVMDGWQFRREQLSDASIASVPVLVLSADASVESRADAMRAVGYLKKPIPIDRLLEAVAEHTR